MKNRDICLASILLLLLFANSYAEDASTESKYGARLEGSFVQGGLIVGQTKPGSSVKFDSNPVRVSDDGVFLVGFGRDAKLEWPLSIIHPDGKTFNSKIVIAKREYQLQRIDGVPDRTVNPLPEDLDRIRADVRQVQKARRTDHSRTDFLEGFDWPATGIITGVYGSQRIINGEPRRPHYGIDIAAPAGTPVAAPVSGIVTMAHPDMFFSGATLIVDHGHGLSSTFLHLDNILVSEGEYVNKGQIVALVGSTGRSTGAHLDWRINLFKTRLDPELIAGAMPAPQH